VTVDAELPGRSRAAVADAPHTTRMCELPLPAPGIDDGLLSVEATGVSGGDWELYERGPGGVILGREIVGRVAALGRRAAERWGVRVGDRIAVEEFLPCGICPACRRRDHHRCRSAGPEGGSGPAGYGRTPVSASPGLYGGFSQYLYLHPRSVVHRVSESVDARAATLFAPLAAGVRWVVRQAGTRPGETVVVLGSGRLGLGCVLAARHAGAGAVVLVGPAARWQRLHTARHVGADHVVFAGEEDAVAAVRDLTGGRGAETVVHLGAAAGSVRDAVEMAAHRGAVVLAARDGRTAGADLPYETVVRKELRLLGAGGHGHRSVAAALAVIDSGRYPLHLLTTHHFPLEEADAALRTAAGRTGEHAIHVSVGA
jgi:threonine dehydrogenase-like Zn-dependent dehydrogenase